MSTQHDMKPDYELYRAILHYEVQPTRQERNPHYDPMFRHNSSTTSYDRKKQAWAEFIRVPDGPEVTKEHMIGPYREIKYIKAYVTRNRGRNNGKNLRINRIERVSAWEEVSDY